MEKEEYPESIEIRSYKPTTKPSNRQIRKAAELIANSKKPIFMLAEAVSLEMLQKSLESLRVCLAFQLLKL